MAQNLTIVGFDADDTLWHNERFFHLTQARFAELLADFVEGDHLADRLLEAERRNIGHYGFGVKGFVLSMIETAIEVTDGRVPTSVISELMEAGREMLRYPIELLPHAEDAVRAVSETHKTVLITKGDLLDQDRKLAQSGLGDFFDGVEIVSDKSLSTYQTIFKRFGTPMENAMMVGNSMRSDVVPVVEGGGWGVFVPHGLEWDLEKADPPKDAPRFATLDDLSGLETLIAQIG
jgi:putative hydrolase of the HAD superfamily